MTFYFCTAVQGENTFGPVGFFFAAITQVATGKNPIASSVSSSYNKDMSVFTLSVPLWEDLKSLSCSDSLK